MQRARATCGLSCNIVVLIKRVDMTVAISSQGRFPVISCWKAQARLRSEIGRGMRSDHRNDGKWCIRQKHGRIERRNKQREQEGARDANAVVLTPLHARRAAGDRETVAFADRLGASGGTGQDSAVGKGRTERAT